MRSMHWARRRHGGGPALVPQRVIHVDPDILGGAPVFLGIRVPLRAPLDDLEAGQALDEFLDDFPTLSRAQAVAALQEVKQQPGTRARSSG
jgi:uncharacterized protein (DUF433 family)